MADSNFLLEQSQVDGSYQLRLKVKYLQEDKQKLEVSNKQMKENIQLLRDINKELAKNFSQTQQNQLLHKLQQQNSHLQTCYLRIMDQNNALTCRNLMLQQIIQEQQSQQVQILKGYENKIVELRRSIQFKESCIQSFEQSSNCNANGYEVGNIPPSNISMVFFTEIDQYKTTIKLLENRIIESQKELQKFQEVNRKLEDHKMLVDSLVSSRYGFLLLKERLNTNRNDKTRSLSQHKLEISKKLSVMQKQLLKNNQNSKLQKQQKSKSTLRATEPQQTRQTSYQCTSGNFKLNQLKDQLKKANTQLAKLSINYKKQLTKRKENDQKIKILLNSNKFYKEKRQTNTDQLNYFKRSTSDLLRLIEKRKIKRTYSVDKTEVEKLISSIKKPQEIQLVQNNKKYWKKIQEQLKNKISQKTKTDLEIINRFRLKKSFSDILDFSPMCHDDDKIDKYYNQKNTHKQNFKNQRELQSHQRINDLDDFSRVLQLGADGEIFDDQTLIIKAKPISYAERKKTKTKSKVSDVHNLTIIRENIL